MTDDSTQTERASRSAGLSDDEISSRIVSGLGQLDRPQLALLYRYMTAMQRPVTSQSLPGSDIAEPKFVAAVGHYLALHHATQTTALNKKGFEFLFQFACDAAGRNAAMNRNTTDANADVIVDGVGFSLKTQADKAVKRHTLYIQKLMEARWIREINSPQDFHDSGVRHILEHLGRYERILVLKVYPRAGSRMTYELVEVPMSLFGLLSNLGVADFPSKNQFGTCSVSVPDAQGEAFRLVFDGSVEKIRIFNLRARNCVSHAEWTVSVPDDEDG